MSTRCTTHFLDEEGVVAIVYRHWDGYPKVAGTDLCKFITRCKKLSNSRLGDASYLAARYVVFLGEVFASDGMFEDPAGKLHKHAYNFKNPTEKRKYVIIPRKNRLNFTGVGIVLTDPGDIEYRYTVDCSKIVNGRPEVKCFKVNIGDDGRDKTREEVPIPGFTKVAPVVETWKEVRTVPSRTNRKKSYTIERNSATMALRCSCPDFKYRASKNGPCKHICALPVTTRYIEGVV